LTLWLALRLGFRPAGVLDREDRDLTDLLRRHHLLQLRLRVIGAIDTSLSPAAAVLIVIGVITGPVQSAPNTTIPMVVKDHSSAFTALGD
jgi:hypothetical protein